MSAFSCGVRSPAEQPIGKPSADDDVEPDDTCMSENTTLPHLLFESIGVVYWKICGRFVPVP